MAPLPTPQGMSEADYETIEAAVTETVRGRWFLGEFARRNRTAEMRQLLDAMARIESAMTPAAAQPALPPADPSIRLLMQRIKEIAGQLEDLSGAMRESGVDPQFAEAVEHQARAVGGMMRAPGRVAAAARPELAKPQPAGREPGTRESETVAFPAVANVPDAVTSPDTMSEPPAMPMRMPRADLPQSLLRPMSNEGAEQDARLAALSALDGLALAKKLALFS